MRRGLILGILAISITLTSVTSFEDAFGYDYQDLLKTNKECSNGYLIIHIYTDAEPNGVPQVDAYTKNTVRNGNLIDHYISDKNGFLKIPISKLESFIQLDKPGYRGSTIQTNCDTYNFPSNSYNQNSLNVNKEQLVFCRQILDEEFCFADINAPGYFLIDRSFSSEQTKIMQEYFSKNKLDRSNNLSKPSSLINDISPRSVIPTSSSTSVATEHLQQGMRESDYTSGRTYKVITATSNPSSSNPSSSSNCTECFRNSISTPIIPKINTYNPIPKINLPDITTITPPSINYDHITVRPIIPQTTMPTYSPQNYQNINSYSPYNSQPSYVREWHVPQFDPFGITGRSSNGFTSPDGLSNFRDIPLR